MKKLMIAAAAVAMVAGAYAEGEKYIILTEGDETNKVAVTTGFDDLQVITIKSPSQSTKYYNLNAGAKVFGKTAKLAYAPVTTVIYRDLNDTNETWKAFAYSKDAASCATNSYWTAVIIRDYNIFVDAASNYKKAVAPFSWALYTEQAGITDYGLTATNNYAFATSYFPLTVKRGEVNKTIKSIKFMNGSTTKVSVKAYKNEDAQKKAIEKLMKSAQKIADKAGATVKYEY